MARINHTANAARSRVRLISTPNHGGLMATTTFEGVRFSDTLAALLDHAAAHGFRFETKGRGKSATLIAYPPDPEHRPINVGERDAKFNRPHYENLRREFIRAGMPPLPTDQHTDTDLSEENPMPAAKPVKHIHNDTQMTAELRGPDRANVLAGIVDGLFDRADLEGYSGLAAGLTYAVATWAEEAAAALGAAASQAATLAMQKDIDEALKLAADAEAKAARMETALAKSDAALEKAKADCAAALDRARVAEAKAAELEGALAPLRNLLGKVS